MSNSVDMQSRSLSRNAGLNYTFRCRNLNYVNSITNVSPRREREDFVLDGIANEIITCKLETCRRIDRQVNKARETGKKREREIDPLNTMQVDLDPRSDNGNVVLCSLITNEPFFNQRTPRELFI